MDRKETELTGASFDLDNALSVAVTAAKDAGRIQAEYRGKAFNVKHKGETDLVTEVDMACEEAIVAIIRQKYPEHGIVAEEREPINQESGFTWVIDPLDGTTNYAHGFPVYCVSIALQNEGKLLVGAVYDSTRDELFTAISGGGSFLNGSPITVSSTSKLIESLIATGFPYSIKTVKNNNLKQFGRMVMQAQAIRRPGAAALDLVYVACGRLDGFWEFHLYPWDTAAGALIVMEAGGRVTLSDGSELDIYRKDIVASNGLIHDVMLLELESG